MSEPSGSSAGEDPALFSEVELLSVDEVAEFAGTVVVANPADPVDQSGLVDSVADRFFDGAGPADSDVERVVEAVPAGTGNVVPVRSGPGRVLARTEDRYVEPVRRLNAALSDILDVDGHPERDPDAALTELRTAMDTFQQESADWL